MSQKVTIPKMATGKYARAGKAFSFSAVCLVLLVSTRLAVAQQPDWRRIGNSAIDLQLAGVTTGAVSRVWYSADGARLFAVTASLRQRLKL